MARDGFDADAVQLHKIRPPDISKLKAKNGLDKGVHFRAQKIFRDQFSSAYNIELDLIFAEPDGAALKPNSISASVSALFKRLKNPKTKGREPPPIEAFPRVAPVGRGHGTSRRIRATRPQFGNGDGHSLLAPTNRKRPGSRNQMGKISEVKRTAGEKTMKCVTACDRKVCKVMSTW